jgi:putative ABC transport system ATP-binding protein
MSAGMARVGELAAPVLELDAVSKIYPSQPPVVALRGVSLTVRSRELLAVVGPSGSGKTTLLHLMGTLDRPTSGTVRIIGQDAAALSDRNLAALRATSIGFVFQQFFLNEHATVLDNVADGLLYAGSAFPSDPRPARLSFLAGSGSGSRSPGLWWARQRSCSRTSRPATSTRPPAHPCWPCSTN